MKLLESLNSRIVLLVGLAIIQAGLTYDFCMHRNLSIFLGASSIVILLAATLYWIEWLVRHEVTNFEVCMAIGAGAIAAILWIEGNRVAGVIVACAGLFYATMLLRRLFRQVPKDQQEENLRSYRAEANRVSPITRYASALIVYALFAGAIWAINGFVFPRYGDFLFILALWDLSTLIYHIVKRKRTTSAPIENAADHGGRS